MSSQPPRPYGTAPSSSPQPYGTAIPMQGQPRTQMQQAPAGPYGSGSAPVQPQRPLAPGTPYRPVQAGPNSLQGYSPSLARGYGQGQPSAQIQPQVQPQDMPYARPPPPQGGYTPQQQQQLMAMRQMQQRNVAPATSQEDAPAPAPAQIRSAPAPAPAPAPSPKASAVSLRLERTFHPVREPNTPWTTQGIQSALGLAIQGSSLVFQQPGVVALYVSVQQAPPEMLLRLVNPLTQDVVAFAYGNENTAFLTLVKPVDAGEAWQLQTMVPFPDPDGDEPPQDVQAVTMVAQIAKLA